jgi:hypothetical protein
MSAEEVQRSLDFTLGRVALGASSASPLSGDNSQGTSASSFLFGGGLHDGLASVKLGSSVLPDAPTDTYVKTEANPPVTCMFITVDENMNTTCLGCVGAKGEKFCTKPKLGSGELDTCGVNAHSKKAVTQPGTLYFVDGLKAQGFMTPALSTGFELASDVWDMRSEMLSRVQFQELVALVRSQEVTTSEELLEAKTRIQNPAKGVSFTPRKKPRFSNDPTWEYAEADMLPSIPEIPDTPGGLQDHIVTNWSAMLETVAAVKANMGKQKRYESEIFRLSEDLDGLRSVASRLLNLVGQPSDGTRYDLFALVDVAEDRFMEVEDAVKTNMKPRVESLERSTGNLVKDLEYFKANIGDDMVTKVTAMEASLKAFEAHAGGGNEGEVTALRTVLVNEIMPALRDLWNLYMMTTKGPGQSLRPGSGEAAGEHLTNRISVLETALRTGAGTHGATLSIEQRIRSLESQASAGGGNDVGYAGIPSLFGQSLGGGLASASGPAQAVGDQGMGVNATGDLTSRVNTLFSRVKELDAQLGNVTVVCGGQTFRSVEDCETFIVEHVPGNTYAHFYDMVSLLQRSWGETHISVSSVWESLYSMKKAGFTCKGEAVIYASMNTILPTCLGELTGKNTESTHPMPALPTHGHWTSKGGQLGRRRDISHCISNVKRTLETQQKSHFAGNLVGSGVTGELLLNAFSHWTHFQNMLDDFYTEFSHTGSGTEAWKLTCMIGKTVLEALHLVRCIAADISDLQTPVKRAARMFWATLQAHRVMGEFIGAEFRNDPRVAPIVVLHLLENRVSKVEVELMQTRLKTQESAHAKLRKEFDALQSRVTSMPGGGRKKKKAVEDANGNDSE